MRKGAKFRIVVRDGRLVTEAVCAGCGKSIPANRKWCSDRCRRHTSYGGVCKRCGAGTYSGNAVSSDVCAKCRNRERAKLGKEAVITALRDWNDRFGSPPTATDWSPANARKNGRLDKVERYRGSGPWPATNSVLNLFGSWNAGIAAADFRPHNVGEYGRPGENMKFCRKLRALYDEGETTVSLAKQYGSSPMGIAYRIKKAGGTLRARGDRGGVARLPERPLPPAKRETG